MIEHSKNVHLVNVPETGKDWPMPPEYVSPWPSKKVYEAIEAETKPVLYDYYVEEAAVQDLMFDMKKDFDQALSEALFELWQYKGIRNDD